MRVHAYNIYMYIYVYMTRTGDSGSENASYLDAENMHNMVNEDHKDDDDNGNNNHD
ncbi:uncharacterized protein LOC125046480, partial [Penaeus chinensis]|uniref:uncharacterized protein LOC125046480 n=1 Tax=Penaeus chinensis TaxID=139456 RepID=UPI001FB66E64